MEYENPNNKVIKILLLNTGKNSNKAERIIKVIHKLKLNEFALSYGDCVGNVNLTKLYKMHLNSKRIMSVASIKPKSQYGHFSPLPIATIPVIVISISPVSHYIHLLGICAYD